MAFRKSSCPGVSGIATTVISGGPVLGGVTGGARSRSAGSSACNWGPPDRGRKMVPRWRARCRRDGGGVQREMLGRRSGTTTAAGRRRTPPRGRLGRVGAQLVLRVIPEPAEHIGDGRLRVLAAGRGLAGSVDASTAAIKLTACWLTAPGVTSGSSTLIARVAVRMRASERMSCTLMAATGPAAAAFRNWDSSGASRNRSKPGRCRISSTTASNSAATARRRSCDSAQPWLSRPGSPVLAFPRGARPGGRGQPKSGPRAALLVRQPRDVGPHVGAG